jgi:uncharacterized protein (TIGR02118 family)
MIKVLFLFPKSVDLKTVDDLLVNQLVPMVKQVQGFRSIQVSDGDIRSPGGPPPYSKVVEISFDSFDEMMEILQSQKSQPANEFMKSLGTLILLYDVSEP